MKWSRPSFPYVQKRHRVSLFSAGLWLRHLLFWGGAVGVGLAATAFAAFRGAVRPQPVGGGRHRAGRRQSGYPGGCRRPGGDWHGGLFCRRGSSAHHRVRYRDGNDRQPRYGGTAEAGDLADHCRVAHALSGRYTSWRIIILRARAPYPSLTDSPPHSAGGLCR